MDIGGGIFFLEQGSRPEAQPRVYCLAPEKNPPLISTTFVFVNPFFMCRHVFQIKSEMEDIKKCRIEIQRVLQPWNSRESN